MDKGRGERETQDFMNVESFSQLPFFRRPPSKDKNPKPIRLFGKYFTGGDYSPTTAQEDYPYSETNTKEEEDEEEEEEEKDQTGDNNGKDTNSITSHNRRFECHYCFRNFPTSQALGGHQNAHKRERQLAKRGSSSYFHHLDAYNLYGYRHYPSWSSGSLQASRLYGSQMSSPSSLTYHKRSINGSMLGGLWRSSNVQSVYNANAAFTSHNDYSSSSFSSTLPLLAGSQPQPPSSHVGGSASQNLMSSSYGYGLNSNVQDHVSLDLHL